ncbi:MAG: guanylate kinase [Pirellulales bacterium]
MVQSKRGCLIVISGPSGSGKTTQLRELYQRCNRPLVASVSATTRRPRPGEVDGVDYHFIDEDEFARRRAAGDFLECFEVYGRGHWYGTLRHEVATGLEAGKWVVLEIDVQGTKAIVDQFPDAVTIFVRPASTAELEQRLRRRATESEDELRRRLDVARRELDQADVYRYQVVNDDLAEAVSQLCGIVETCGD